MSFTRPQPVPRMPTPPQGDEVAAYATYLEAQQAVDYLSDHKFPVQAVTIVGTDLTMVERVTGRLTYGRVALAGAGSGAWFGLFVGLLLSFFGGSGATSGVWLIGVALGAGFGLLFSVLSYSLTGGRRDFTSQSQIVATTYAILCASDSAAEARQLLLKSPNGLGKGRTGSSGTQASPVGPSFGRFGAQTPAAPPAPTRAPDPRWTTPTGEPRYGAMLPGTQQPAPQQPAAPQQPEPQQPAPPTQQQPPTGQPPATPPSDDPSVTPPTDPYAPPRRD